MTDQSMPSLGVIPFFKQLSAEALAKVTSLVETTRSAAGSTIFLANEPGDALYLIASGRVRIWMRDEEAKEVTLSELGPGDFFGEMSVIDHGSRSASASAIDDCVLGRLRREPFEEFLMGHPAAGLDVLRAVGARLRQTNQLVAARASRNANDVHDKSLSALDRLAVAITDKVGSVGFFLLIATWTLLWTGYNMVASLFPRLGLHAFDPFPAFVAYLLISNVIQIMLMPLIMVGQNLQARHSETRAELDFEVNQKAEREISAVLLHLERNTDLLMTLSQRIDGR